MSVYMTEAEQLEEIKKWWIRHQHWITMTLSLIVIIVAGYRYWNWHMEKTIQQASTAYESMMLAASNHDDKSTQSYANQLVSDFGKTIYASAAHLTLAKVFVGQNDYQKAQLELAQVAHQATMNPLKPIASIRLARILLSEKQYDKALAELATLDASSYASVINELKGDIYSAQGAYPKAIAAYDEAMKIARATGQANLFLEMKINAVSAMVESKNVSQTA